MLRERIITAAITIPILIAYILWGGELAFLILVLVVAGIGLYEFFAATLPDQHVSERILGMVLGLLILCCTFLESQGLSHRATHSYFLPLAGGVFSFVALFLYNTLAVRELAAAFRQITIQSFGIFYVGLSFSYVILLRSLAHGKALVLFLLFVTWAGDAGSYFVGSWQGKHALCPRISPKKTVEGAVGGLLWGILAAALCKLLFLKQLSPLSSLTVGAAISVMNQLGDLSESIIKRAVHLKDSGTLFPGHGGVLDRIDSLLFAAPVLYYYVTLMYSA